jgi:hypothetical protein
MSAFGLLRNSGNSTLKMSYLRDAFFLMESAENSDLEGLAVPFLGNNLIFQARIFSRRRLSHLLLGFMTFSIPCSSSLSVPCSVCANIAL